MLDRRNLNSVFSELIRGSETFAKKIQPIFEANNWVWSNLIPCESVVPTVSNIVDQLEGLCYNTIAEIKKYGDTKACLSAGNLQVRIVQHDNHWYGYLELVPERSIV